MRKSDKAGNLAKFRSERVFYSDGGWFIATREGERGPYPTKRLAMMDMKNYVRRSQEQQDDAG